HRRLPGRPRPRRRPAAGRPPALSRPRPLRRAVTRDGPREGLPLRHRPFEAPVLGDDVVRLSPVADRTGGHGARLAPGVRPWRRHRSIRNGVVVPALLLDRSRRDVTPVSPGAPWGWGT